MPVPGRLDAGVDFGYPGAGLADGPFDPSGMQKMGTNRHITDI
jgi:hypothetical protein